MLNADPKRSLARACLLGGAVGDALGAPVEFLLLAEIRRRHGAARLQDFTAGDWTAGSITDDKQMTLFTAEGLIRVAVREAEGLPTDRAAVVAHAYLRWLLTQGIEAACALSAGAPGLLLGVAALRQQRFPGATCIAALQAMREITGRPATNQRKGCGGVMRVAPAGIWCARGGRADVGAAFDLGCGLAALNHGHGTAALMAGTLAAVIAQLLCGVALPTAIAAAELRRNPDHQETLPDIDDAGAAPAVAAGAAAVATHYPGC